jgi:hypothetical protein
MQRTKNKIAKEKILWVIFMITVLVIFETATYLNTGEFVFCGRYGQHCGSVNGWFFLGIIVFVALFSVFARWLNRKLVGK